MIAKTTNMKKALFVLALIAAVVRVSAQNSVIPNPYNRPSADLYKKYMGKSMMDSLTGRFKVQPNYIFPGNDSSRMHNSIGYGIQAYAYNMPVIKMEGSSKMPIIKTRGNSKMPVFNPDGVNREAEIKILPKP